MALLDAINRARVAMAFMRSENCAGPDKPAISAAVDYTDQWIEDNQPSYVAGLPAAWKNNTNAAQKALLFAYVLWRRVGRLKVTEDG